MLHTDAKQLYHGITCTSEDIVCAVEQFFTSSALRSPFQQHERLKLFNNKDKNANIIISIRKTYIPKRENDDNPLKNKNDHNDCDNSSEKNEILEYDFISLQLQAIVNHAGERQWLVYTSYTALDELQQPIKNIVLGVLTLHAPNLNIVWQSQKNAFEALVMHYFQHFVPSDHVKHITINVQKPMAFLLLSRKKKQSKWLVYAPSESGVSRAHSILTITADGQYQWQALSNVAIKCEQKKSYEDSDKDSQKRAQQEYTVLCQLYGKDNVQYVEDLNENPENSRFYCIKPYIPGITLEAYFTQLTAMNDTQRLAFVIQLLQQTQAYFETLSVIHGDIKPENLIVNNHTTTLIDWGVSGKVGDEHTGYSIPYCPPDHRADSAGIMHLSAHVDRFALMKVAFQCLVGGHALDTALTQWTHNPEIQNTPEINQWLKEHETLTPHITYILHVCRDIHNINLQQIITRLASMRALTTPRYEFFRQKTPTLFHYKSTDASKNEAIASLEKMFQENFNQKTHENDHDYLFALQAMSTACLKCLTTFKQHTAWSLWLIDCIISVFDKHIETTSEKHARAFLNDLTKENAQYITLVRQNVFS
jgi:tRNA A-37 threonylcarbamoyl transferase component Bud32